MRVTLSFEGRSVRGGVIGALASLAIAGTLTGQSPLPPMNGWPEDFAPRRAGVEVDAAIRITVTNEGLYRLSQPDLVAAGVDPLELTGNRLRLFCSTRESALYVSNGGLWTADDYLVFFAEKFEGYYSAANVYWLGFGESGKRMTGRPGEPFAGIPDTLTCPWRASYALNAFLQDKYRPEDESLDHWFAAVLNESAPVKAAMRTEHVEPSEPAVLTAVLYGHSSSSKINPDHDTRLKVNGKPQADFMFDGLSGYTGITVFAGSRLKETNTIWLQQFPRQGLSVDRVLLKSISIDYARKLRPSNGSLLFTGKAGASNYQIQGVSDADGVWLAEVGDPSSPVLLSDYSVAHDQNGAVIRFGDAPTEPRRYVICQDAALQTVSKVERVAFRGLASPDRQADYILIGPAAFIPQMNRLAVKRIREGLSVEVVALPDIFNEFGYGINDATAIKQFIGYAYHHWREPRPRYVLLAGNGSYDPRGYLLASRGKKAYVARERVPVHMGPTVHGWAALDGWYAQVDGADRLADLALGRLPAESPAMMSNMVNKIFAYESVPRKNRKRREALLVADRSDRSMDGKRVCEELRRSCLSPAGFWCTTGYSDVIGETLVNQTVTESFESGVSLVYYFGHGDVSRWGYDILTSHDLAAFRNAYCPVVLMMACRNGAFQNPVAARSMTEAFLQAADHGASACIGTTAISFGSSAVVFAEGFSRSLVTEKATRLGDAFLGGLADVYDYNPLTQELLYLNLFADPAMVINPP